MEKLSKKIKHNAKVVQVLVDRSYLSPNSLLLRRSSKKIISGPFQPDGEIVEELSKFTNRFLFLHEIIEQF